MPTMRAEGRELGPFASPEPVTVAPLSFAQEQIWLHERRSAEGAYNFAELFDIVGPLDVRALEAALSDVVARHDALRTRYDVTDGIAFNVVTPGEGLTLECADLRRAGSDSRAAAKQWCNDLARRPYILTAGTPFRPGFARYRDDAALLVLAYHHLAYDYTSGGLILADLSDAYAARAASVTPAFPDQPRFVDYAARQRNALASDDFARQRRFWQGVFATVPPAVALPGTVSGDGRGPASAGATLSVEIPLPVVSALRALAASENASLFTGILAALRTLTQRYTGLDDFVIGVPVAARRSAQLRSLVGCTVNTVPVRTDVAAGATFREALRATRDAAHAAYEAQDYPYSAIVRDATSGRPRADGGFVQLSATMRDRHRPTLRLGAARVEPLTVDLGFATFDCALVVSEHERGLSCTFQYRTARVSEASLQAFAAAFVRFVASAVADPERSCATLALASDAELRRLAESASGPVRFGEPTTLDRIVRERARRAPDAVAIVAGAEVVSYAELVRRADAVARALRSRDVRGGMRIGVCADRSPNLIAAIVGIAASGATYVPLDPALPAARLAAIATDAQLVYTLVDRTQAARFPSGRTIDLQTVDDSSVAAGDTSPSGARPDDIAYVIYTSGSTGTPKGIEIQHRALANLGRATSEALALRPEDRCLFRASIAFDASLSEIAAPLCAGAAVVIAPSEQSADPRALIETAIEQRVSVLGTVPSLLAALLEEPRFTACALRAVTSGGEVLGAAIVRRFFAATDAALYNLYGPSEAAGHVTIHACSVADIQSCDEDVPLGRPIANATVSIRDAALRPVPPGAIGEIVIGGLPLSVGYLQLPIETAKRFIADPYADGNPSYRTGDLGRLRPDGTLLFLGRSDAQVKIRGVRIEPRDVAIALEAIRGVRQAFVVARPRSQDAERHDLLLVAYVVTEADTNIDAAVVRGELSMVLPAYMLPAALRFIDAMPLTRNGKVDAANLRARAVDAPDGVASRPARRAPESPTEVRIAALWETLLGRGALAAADDFFAVGGDSLLALRLISRLERTFGRRIAASTFFDEPTIAALARTFDSEAARAIESERDVERYQRDGTRTPFVFLHGDFAGGRYARRLSTLLGPEQPVTTFGPYGAAGRPLAADVETMADDLAERITEIHPTGALRLGGYSMAGNLALEVARRLEARGRTIEDLVIIGTDAGNVRFRAVERLTLATRLPAAQRRELIRRVRRAVNVVAAFVRGDAAWRRARLRSALRFGRQPEGLQQTWTGLDLQAYERYVRAQDAFVPRPYVGRVLLIWPREQISRASDFRRDWRKLAPNLTVAPIAGDHDAAVTTHLDELARIVRDRLSISPT